MWFVGTLWRRSGKTKGGQMGGTANSDSFPTAIHALQQLSPDNNGSIFIEGAQGLVVRITLRDPAHKTPQPPNCSAIREELNVISYACAQSS